MEKLDQTVITEIEEALKEYAAERFGDEIRFLCPAHDDTNPSASWNPKKGVWHCFGCEASGDTMDLAAQLGIDTLPGLTMEQLAEAKGIPVGFLRELGVTQGRFKHQDGFRPCVLIPYRNLDGEAVALRKRLTLNGPDRFRWRRGDKPCLYGLDRLDEARKAGYAWIVEGESDCWTLWYHGIPAIGVPGAQMWANVWRPEYEKLLEGVQLILWQEPDHGGEALLAAIARDLPNAWVFRGDEDLEDPSQLYGSLEHDSGDFQTTMDRIRQECSERISDLTERTLAEQAEAHLAASEGLLDDPRLLDRIGETMRAGGYAGDLRPPKLVYIALTSRLLNRPVNLAIISPSSAGKNRTILAGLELIPGEGVVRYGATSPKAFIYDDEDFAHKIVVYDEADSIPDEGSAATAMRSLAEDNVVRYAVTQQDPRTGEFRARHISKLGPTGLMTTSTRALASQLSTRMLTVELADTEKQTRDVLRSIAREASGTNDASPKLEPYIAAQRWLALVGRHNIVVPFAEALAQLVPADQQRMKRDFQKLLTAIQALALLRQRLRDLDPEGRVIAKLEDYEDVRDLLMPVFSSIGHAGVNPAVRETIKALEDAIADEYADHWEEPAVKTSAVASLLRVDPSTALRRLQRCQELGYAQNLRPGQGRTSAWAIGEPLPEQKEALPSVEEIRRFIDAQGSAGDEALEHRKPTERRARAGREDRPRS